MGIDGYNRIILVGSGGSGKSWLATRIAEVTGLPLFHLDKEFWQPDWVMPPAEQRLAMQQRMIAGQRWIIDGNYNSTMELRFAAAELVIFCDVNRLVCLWGAVRRAGKKRPDLPEYLTEPVVFSKDFFEFARWIWKYPSTGRKAVMALHGKYPEKAFWQITSRRQMNRLVRNW